MTATAVTDERVRENACLATGNRLLWLEVISVTAGNTMPTGVVSASTPVRVGTTTTPRIRFATVDLILRARIA